MATGALLIGWGPAVRGREHKALQVFNETIQFYTQLQQQGTIENFETVGLEPHGGDLLGFTLVCGDLEKLNALRTSEEFLRLTNRGRVAGGNVSVVTALIGSARHRLYAD